MNWQTVNFVFGAFNAVSFAAVLVWAWRNRRRLPSVSVWGMRDLDAEPDDDIEPLDKPEYNRRLTLEFLDNNVYRLNLEIEYRRNRWANERYYEGNANFIVAMVPTFRVKGKGRI
jgi:hypothetical protein